MDASNPAAVVTPPLTAEQRPVPVRALALDAFRGIAILLMCLSGRIQNGALSLPAWMYHAQNPPPDEALNRQVAGFTWVDLIFPMFLFSMGVAIPFAMSGKLAKGVPQWRLALGAFGRMFSLVAFAIYFDHVTPGIFLLESPVVRAIAAMGMEPSTAKWIVGLIGFAILFPIYMRFPVQWKPAVQWSIRCAGIVLAILLLSGLLYKGPNGTMVGVDLARSNIILVVLGNMAFFGTTVWLLTRGSALLRLLVTALFVAALLEFQREHSILKPILQPDAAFGIPAFLQRLTGKQNFLWLYNFTFLKYLTVVLPGTIIGEMLMRWMKNPMLSEEHDKSRAKLLLVSFLITGAVIYLHICLQSRWMGAAWATGIASTFGVYLWMYDRPTPTRRLIRTMIGWAGIWLVVGLLLDPTEGGIRKTPLPEVAYNFSYCFVSLGISILLLAALTIWMDILGRKNWFWLFVDNGQNPMLAYIGINNLMTPIVVLTGVSALAKTLFLSPWTMFHYSLFTTLLLALLTCAFTRARVIWRT
ncbi:DUF5009 domain-containing protein [soil metagenome]